MIIGVFLCSYIVYSFVHNDVDDDADPDDNGGDDNGLFLLTPELR